MLVWGFPMRKLIDILVLGCFVCVCVCVYDATVSYGFNGVTMCVRGQSAIDIIIWKIVSNVCFSWLQTIRVGLCNTMIEFHLCFFL